MRNEHAQDREALFREVAKIYEDKSTVTVGEIDESLVDTSVVFRPYLESELGVPVHVRFEAAARRFGDRVAVRYADRECRYSDLNRAANRIARVLLTRAGPGSAPVLLLLDKGASLFASMLGTLKAGKFYVALSPSYPAARNQFIAADSRAQLVLTDTANAGRAGETGLPLVNVDEIDPRADSENPHAGVSDRDYAYIIYTSGSSGQPKGVVDTHRNLAQNIRRYTNSHRITDADRLICVNSCAFSNSLKDIYGALLNGGRLVSYDLERLGVDPLADFVAREEVTILSAVATVFRHFTRGLRDPRQVASLRIVRVGSEAVTRKDFDLFRAHFPSTCAFVNGYGSTETGTVRVNFLYPDSPAGGGSTLPVGYPVDGTEVLLLDEDGRDVGFDRVGQIVVRSEYLSPGYWNRPDLTRAAFRDAPDGSRGRTYLTGDYGILRPDGCLIYLGRNDSQVKVRGNRIELAEVENALTDIPGVAEAVVVSRPELPPDQPLVGYVVARPGMTVPPAADLRAALRARLPDPAVPGTFVTLAALPVTSTGKIDRNALPAPPAPAGRAERRPPRTAVEVRLVAIWEEVLGSKPVGVGDDFFAIGGTSLVATDLMNRISKEFGRALPLACLIERPTIEHLAALIESRPQAEWPGLVAIRASGSRPPLYLVHDILGGVMAYRNLGTRLGDEQPVYGIQSRSATGGTVATSIEAMATGYVAELVRHRPSGPLLLGGYSFGAVVAYEMAQQLLALGRDVPLLGLIDQRRPNLDRGYPWTPRAVREFVANCSRRVLQDSRSVLKAEVILAARGVFGALRPGRAGSGTTRPGPAGQADGTANTPESATAGQTMYRALRAYQPRPYRGRVLLVQARFQPLFRWHEQMMGWKNLLPGPVEVRYVPAIHNDVCSDPAVHVLAAHFREALDAAHRPATA